MNTSYPWWWLNNLCYCLPQKQTNDDYEEYKYSKTVNNTSSKMIYNFLSKIAEASVCLESLTNKLVT